MIMGDGEERQLSQAEESAPEVRNILVVLIVQFRKFVEIQRYLQSRKLLGRTHALLQLQSYPGIFDSE